jgi:hypothetical protein
MSDAVERLKWLRSPDAERLSDGERINQFVKYGLEAITELEQRIEFMGAIYRIPVFNCFTRRAVLKRPRRIGDCCERA